MVPKKEKDIYIPSILSSLTTTINNNISSIMVVNEKESIGEVIAAAINDAEYECDAASNADEALARIGQNPPDLILSEIEMSSQAVIGLLDEVRNHSREAAVIMITAMANSETEIEALKAYSCATQNFNLVEVLASMEPVFEKRALLITNRKHEALAGKQLETGKNGLRQTYLGAIKALAQAMEAVDPYTRGHSLRVTEISVLLAREMGLSNEMTEKIRLAARVHDIGKIGIAGEVLCKPGKLMEQEFEAIKGHPSVGERILKPVINDPVVLDIVCHHHERFSGGGYPSGFCQNEICLGARLLAVADAYDAMTSTRPYRSALPPEKADEQLLENRGSQFDPDVVDLFIRVKDKLPFCPVSARLPG
ncbi:MAG: HD domain-containing protein [Thermoleophilia bacterium]|nr:HD domain-containing protein [Thermoleophilia bacterium]